MATGYNIQCQAGDLYTRQCFIGDPKDGKKIIAYTSSGDPIAYDQTTGKTYLQRLDATGNAYEPYGSAGVPYTIMDILLSSFLAVGSREVLHLNFLPDVRAKQKSARTTVLGITMSLV